MSRKTFSGIILRQASEFLGEWKKLWKWDCSNNISHTKASEILETIADQIRKESPQDPPSKD